MNLANRQEATEDIEPVFERSVTSERVKEYIIKAVLTGEFQPGDRIVEISLARQLGISTAPVREAVRDLTSTGFLESRPFKGSTVCSLSPRDMWEVYTLRATMETLAVRLVAPQLADADLANLQAILDDMIAAAAEDDRTRTIELDNLFHETLLQLSGHKLLHKAWHSIGFGMWTLFSYYGTNLHQLNFLTRRHAHILDALRTRDPEVAACIIEQHFVDLADHLRDQ